MKTLNETVQREVNSWLDFTLSGQNLVGVSIVAYLKESLGQSDDDTRTIKKGTTPLSGVLLSVESTERVVGAIALSPSDWANLPDVDFVQLYCTVDGQDSTGRIFPIANGKITVKRTAILAYP